MRIEYLWGIKEATEDGIADATGGAGDENVLVNESIHVI